MIICPVIVQSYNWPPITWLKFGPQLSAFGYLTLCHKYCPTPLPQLTFAIFFLLLVAWDPGSGWSCSPGMHRVRARRANGGSNQWRWRLCTFPSKLNTLNRIQGRISNVLQWWFFYTLVDCQKAVYACFYSLVLDRNDWVRDCKLYINDGYEMKWLYINSRAMWHMYLILVECLLKNAKAHEAIFLSNLL